MQKELTVLTICILALFADALLFWQILNFRHNGILLIDSFYGGTILASLILAALCLLWFSYILVCKIIDRTLD
jgi:hypothetical protein